MADFTVKLSLIFIFSIAAGFFYIPSKKATTGVIELFLKIAPIGLIALTAFSLIEDRKMAQTLCVESLGFFVGIAIYRLKKR